MTAPESPQVLILGAGVNGACVARELVLNGVSVWVADKFDIAFGATSKSSRLIHGGLRYLEYGDVDLVHESLEERTRLLKLAPQFVRPLKLYIPVRRRFGGLLAAGLRYLKLTRFNFGARLARALTGAGGRGLSTVRMGLWRYDRLAGRGNLPAHSVCRVGEQGPRVAPDYRWLCSYFDAQMPFPERFTLALLQDARRVAEEKKLDFRVLTHHAVRMEQGVVELRSSDRSDGQPLRIRPQTIINATGAWGDDTLRDLSVSSPQLFGGTKGSHIITRHRGLVDAIGGEAVYAEADDGRLVFVLPFDDAVLVGTTDERFEAPPEQAVATDREIDYLIEMVNDVLPQVQLTRSDVQSHYCGVRPLPALPTGATGAIPRGHWIETTTAHGFTIDTLIGGKLTTCRSLGEEVTDRVLARLEMDRNASTRERPVPGAEGLTTDRDQQARFWSDVANSTGFSIETTVACGKLLGSDAVSILKSLATTDERQLVASTPYPRGFVRSLLKSEWIERLDDLIERRLMLTEGPGIDRQTLVELAQLMNLEPQEADRQIVAAESRLREHYGIHVAAADVKVSAIVG